MNKQWKQIQNHRFYWVSDHGDIWSCYSNRCIGSINYRGKHKIVHLDKKTYYIHTLVLTEFVGPRPPFMEACHNDGNGLNNHVSNLRWDDKAANAQDTIKHGNNFNYNKEFCPIGHKLVEPNLVNSLLIRGRRYCKSCHRAKTKVRNALQRHGTELDFHLVAQQYYSQLMGDL